MVSVMTAASYVYYRYAKEFHSKIDEMKLHKLLYFAQRESIIQTDTPLFDASFYGWRFGPILKEIREAYSSDSFVRIINPATEKELLPIMDVVFQIYASKDSWSLSRLTHGETSWQKSRAGIPDTVNSDRKIDIADIRIDANRIKERRNMFAHFGSN